LIVGALPTKKNSSAPTGTTETSMKVSVALPVAAVGLVLFIAFARYETIAPCGMLRSELKREALASLPELDADSGGFAMLGFAIGAVALDRAIEARTGAMGPLDCLGALVRLHTRGLPETFSEELSAAAPSRSPSSTSVPPPTWDFVSTTDPIDDSVFRRASIFVGDDALWIYLAGNEYVAGLRPDEIISSGAREIEFRVDTNTAFSRRITSNENRNAFVTLTEAQVDQMVAGTELLVRYQGISGSELLRFPLTGSREAIEQVGRPRPPPPPPPAPPSAAPASRPPPRVDPPSFTSLAERIPEWEKRYGIGSDSSTARNAAAVWDACFELERVGPPPHTADDRGRVLNCAMGRGFPLAQAGGPTQPPPQRDVPPSPEFIELAEQIPRWEQQYGIGSDSSIARNAAAVWESCVQIERVGPPPHTADERGRVLNCVMGRGFPLR
jgi:hypothetical protein